MPDNDDGTFSSPNHLAFSSFSHIQDLSSISYAVGLREDDADSEAIIGRILPMARAKPGKPMEKRQPKIAEGPISDCENPECLARQDRYRELGEANAGMRSQYEELEMQLKLTLNKLQLMDKSNKTIEDQNDKLQEQLDEIRSRTAILDAESAQGKTINDGLQGKLSVLEAEIATLRAQADERRRQQEEAERSSATEVIFRRRDPAIQSPKEAYDVCALENWGNQFKAEAATGRQLIRKKTLVLPRR